MGPWRGLGDAEGRWRFIEKVLRARVLQAEGRWKERLAKAGGKFFPPKERVWGVLCFEQTVLGQVSSQLTKGWDKRDGRQG